VTQSDCCEADTMSDPKKSTTASQHAVITSSKIEVADDLSFSKAAAVLELSSADSHSHRPLVKCSTSTDAAANTPVKRPKFGIIKLHLGNKKIKKKKTQVKPSLVYYHILY
jgi:hypothetical protein